MEKISDKEYQASLGNGIPSKIQAVDANSNPILATPTDLLSTGKQHWERGGNKTNILPG